jgi:hypothetical protein
MDEITYLDFDIHIQPAGSGYRVKVVNSPAGQANGEFEMPFSELEIENFVLRVGRTRKGVRRLESPEMESARMFGGRLFQSVFSDEMRGNLRSSLNEASQQNAGLRFRLHLEDSPELADLPWEYLYDSANDEFLVLSVQTPLVRYLDLPIKTETLSTSLPLKILVMISSPSDFPVLDVEKEFQTLVNGLGDLQQRGLVKLVRLEEATLANLQQQLRKDNYHIFHFIGHGGYDEQAEDGVLMLEDENGRGRAVSGRYLGTLLHDEKYMRLAMLNACEGARTSSSDPFSGVAHSLVQKGIPAVIAMQFEITDEAAIVLANEFYGAIADGYPVDASLAEARKAIFAANNDIEWGTPVLYMRSPDGRIFGVDKSTAEAAAAAATAELHVHDGVAHAHAEPVATVHAGATVRGADLEAGAPGAVTMGGGQGGGTTGGTTMPGVPPYPEQPKRSIIPWLVGFIGVAALIVAALVVFDVINFGAAQSPEATFGSGVISVTNTTTPTPTDTPPPPPPTEEIPLPDTGSSDIFTEEPLLEPSETPEPTPTEEPTATEEPTPTVGPTPKGGGPGMVAFASDRSGTVQIWVTDLDGGEPRQVTDILGGACQPAWSPDGMRLVFISPCAEDKERYQEAALYTIKLGAGIEEPLTAGLGGRYDPSWAPSELILFTSEETNQPNLNTISPGSGEVQQLTQHSWNYRGDWSHDGQQIAFVSSRLTGIAKIFIMPALGEIHSDGDQAEEFSRGQEFAYNQPRFSPDGVSLIYKKTPPNSSSPRELMLSRLTDQGKLENTIGSPQNYRPFNDADYSPDGSWIVFESWRDGDHDIYIMTAFGSSIQQVTSGGSFNFDPAWRPSVEP